MSTAPPITAEQLEYVDIEGHCVELIEGRVHVTAAGGTWHSVVTMNIGALLKPWIDEHDLGLALIGEPGFLLARGPDTVRAPDFAFIRRDRLPDPPPDEFPALAPDFCVEVVGKPNRPEPVHVKARDVWLAKGCEEVWVVDPRERAVTVHLPEGEPEQFGEREIIAAHGALAGFACEVSQIFRGL